MENRSLTEVSTLDWFQDRTNHRSHMFPSISDSQSASSSTWSIGTALGAAIGASACCTMPLALVSLGVGGAWMGSLTGLASYRWIFVTLAVSALGYAGYSEWQFSRRPDCGEDTGFSSTMRRVLLGVGTVVVGTFIVSPWLIAPSPNAATQQIRASATESASAQDPAEQKASTPASFRQVVLKVEGMTCATCPKTVKAALTKIDGVYRVEATFEPPEAAVRFDPAQTSVEALVRATKNAGYPSSPKSSS